MTKLTGAMMSAKKLGLLVIDGERLRNVAGICREGTTVLHSTPHTHVKCVVGSGLFSVVKPKHKIMLPHCIPELKLRSVPS